MPFKSEAQRRKFGEIVKQGKMSQETFDEWNSATGKEKLPERIGAKKEDGTRLHTSIGSIIKHRKEKYGS